MNDAPSGIAKLETGVPGLDAITLGGLPAGRATLVSGTSGSGKTVLALQFLANGVRSGQSGVFVTCEESPAEIRDNAASFGWDIGAWERDGRWAFVDASPEPGDREAARGEYDLSGLLSRLSHAIERTGAVRVSIDSIASILNRFQDTSIVRRDLHRVLSFIKSLGVTVVVTSERATEEGPIARSGIEEFVADNVLVLRNTLENRARRRTVEPFKFRGAAHLKGKWPFAIDPDSGIRVLPYYTDHTDSTGSKERISMGQPELDAMLGGGVYRGAVVLASGPTGTGKTMLVTHFIAGAAKSGERCLLVAFEESRAELRRNAKTSDVDFGALEAQGALRIHSDQPGRIGVEEQLAGLERLIDEFRPHRVVVDGMSAMERGASQQAYHDFVSGLKSLVKQADLVGLWTATTPSLLGGESITDAHISTLTDVVILLRYAEVYGAVKRAITVLKVRGSSHDKDIRELSFDGKGMHIGSPFTNVTGFLSGHLSVITDDELSRMGDMFAGLPR